MSPAASRVQKSELCRVNQSRSQFWACDKFSDLISGWGPSRTWSISLIVFALNFIMFCYFHNPLTLFYEIYTDTAPPSDQAKNLFAVAPPTCVWGVKLMITFLKRSRATNSLHFERGRLDMEVVLGLNAG